MRGPRPVKGLASLPPSSVLFSPRHHHILPSGRPPVPSHSLVHSSVRRSGGPSPSIVHPQSAMQPFLLLLLASFSFLLPPPAASAAESSGCWPKACGELNITYPFWLEEPGKPPCGPPSFKLKCSSNRAFLTKSVYQAYEVLSIFPSNKSFHVVDHNLPLDTGCPPPTMNISLFSPRTFVFSRANKELLFLGKCTGGSTPANSTGFHSLACDNSSFVRLGDGREFSSDGIHGGIPQGCLFAVVPVLGGNGDDYIASMKNGFLVEWKVDPDDCLECMARGGECTYGGDRATKFDCDCSGDKCGEFSQLKTPRDFA
ncbi:hypothetical protein BDA96_03G085400 [Sorghum bicolor]|uniref:Wall-associated receptor kinase galacturonan-binding domain-containing protein n=1 Tax=Sorghum bicolor TaxID=4558 RepID=A0A921RBQ7_SORBI|nr:hypothetical protein BDA96_03G085400 [Sorghum bicolor]